MLRWRYPKSFLKLLLVGFAVAVLPLLLAFINANIAFDRIARQGQQTVDNAVETTRASHTLQSQLNVMERSLLQYQVLHEPALLSNYQNAKQQTEDTIQLLLATPAPSKQLTEFRQILQEIDAQVQLPSAQLPSDGAATHPDYANQFAQLNSLAALIAQNTNLQIDIASAALKEKAAKTQKKLFLQSLVLIPLALLSAAFITYMLARPIRRMDDALAQLGQGQYQHAIHIDGPGDLSKLGQRLDWLRMTLLEIDQQKQEFLRHVSHELKTPLTAIREAADLLHDGIGGPLTAQQAEIAKILKENSVKLQKMIENLLNYTKLETMSPPLRIEPVDIRAAVQRTLQGHSLSIQKKSLQVQSDIDESPWLVDREKIQIMLDNLVSNAIKYTPNNGRIRIRAQDNDQRYLLSVSDSGPGISLHEQAKLFRPFNRGANNNSNLVESSGLGLAICKNLAEAHGGTIQLAPQTNNQGATFVIKLPKNQQENPHASC